MTAPDISISNEEADLYDRQIRLWGMTAQMRMKNARICVFGLGSLSGETCKNIVLAGIGSMTLVDDQNVTIEDLTGNFLICANDIGKNRATACLPKMQALNPRVKFDVQEKSLINFSEEEIKEFDVVYVSGCSLDYAIQINNTCRKLDVKFFFGDIFGYTGFFFTDLGAHEFVEESLKNDEKVMTKKIVDFCSLESSFSQNFPNLKARRRRDLRLFLGLLVGYQYHKEIGSWFVPTSEENMQQLIEIKEKTLKLHSVDPRAIENNDLVRLVTCAPLAFSPSAAIVGGILGQEILKCITALAEPHQNFFLYDGLENEGVVMSI